MLENYKLADEDYILTRYQNLLKKQGILTVEDLLYSFPIKYENYKVSSINDAVLDETIVLEGTIVSKVTVNYLKTKLSTVVFQLEVEGRKIRCTIFNRVFLKGKLNYGTVIRVQGRFYQNMNNFTVVDIIICDEINRDIVPIYKTKDISESKYLEIIEKVYRRYKNKIVETLPKAYLEKHHLMDLTSAVKTLHFGDDLTKINEAIRRIKYEELLEYQLSMKYLQYMRKVQHTVPIIEYDEEKINQLISMLPYKLTADQNKSINDILNDLKSPFSMNRLLQGEVGSGKTVVALITILAVVSGGYQAALMCPTEILSQQHYETLTTSLKSFNVNIALLTGSTSTKQRKEIVEGINNGSINVVVGTHALFQKDIEYANLGVVIADEEHRFGVRQRVLIRNKGLDVNYLKMSATPIPRTLAISVYGDTDISVIKTMPENRKKVITKYVDKEHKKEVIAHMKNELKNGHQIYVVTPLIEESDSIDSANAIEIFENMKKYFNNIANVGLIHGKLKAEEKEQIMADFLNKKIDILVATSVIEVGVNVKNATTIVVLGADRFGVATLHQLRGRVMRSDETPYCFYLSDNATPNSEKRLKFVEENTDGFALAEYDLKTRGPGEFFGEKQSGSMNFKYCNLLEDNDLLNLANDDSEEIIKNNQFFNDPEYKHLFDCAHNHYIMKTNELD